MASAKAYERKVSKEEAKESYLLIEKAKLGYFPPEGQPFAIRFEGVGLPARIESYACECRGPELPHRHWFLRLPALTAGKRARVELQQGARYVYEVTLS
ncbi:MAG: hypothetical protein HY875_13020 [Chloroflexi bacterium]|nr:hypothetical protein [Chloroflexota bacterium]